MDGSLYPDLLLPFVRLRIADEVSTIDVTGVNQKITQWQKLQKMPKWFQPNTTSGPVEIYKACDPAQLQTVRQTY